MEMLDYLNRCKEEMTEEQMSSIITLLAKHVLLHSQKEDIEKLANDIYGIVSDYHFDRHFAEKAISNMWYEDNDGNRHHAPYFSEEELETVFEKYQDDISDYTIYDLGVTMNMLRSDNNRFLDKYAKDKDELKDMVVCMSIEYLQDPDAKYPRNKIWHYING